LLEVLEALHEAGCRRTVRQRAQDHRLHREFRVVATDQLGISGAAGNRGHPAQSAGTPIDAFSYEAVELLKDTAAHWQTMPGARLAYATNKDPAVAAALRVRSTRSMRLTCRFRP
jgi:NTE family protein